MADNADRPSFRLPRGLKQFQDCYASSAVHQVDATNRERRPRIRLKRVYLLWFRSTVW
jgi:hypothetical protein